MKGRDLAILGAILLVAGFAVADSVRQAPSSDRRTTEVTTDDAATSQALLTTEVQPEPQPQPEAPPGWPRGVLEGDLVFTDGRDCRVRVIALASGRERPSGGVASTCDLWAAPKTVRIAIGVGARTDATVPFRFVDLARTGRQVGAYRALVGSIIWSPDGQRAAWCATPQTGFELEIGGTRRRLPGCPSAYTPEGDLAYARGGELFVVGRRGAERVIRASDIIVYTRYGRDGSIAAVVDGRRIERFVGGRRRHAVDLPTRLWGVSPVLSPDNCGALLSEGGRVFVVDVGCLGPHIRDMPGKAATWSPDGRWIAAAGEDEIGFRSLTGAETLIWPALAAQLSWR
jgi:hypothetical protein